MQNTKDFSYMEKSWRKILELLGSGGNDFQVFALRPRGIKYFHARAVGQHIIVDTAKMYGNSSSITGERPVDYNQFKSVAEKYNDYISGVKGMRLQMNNIYNTSYLISLIHHLL